MGLDAVEIVMCWEESLGISIPNELAENIFTPRQATERIAQLIGADQVNSGCLSQRAFHRIRNVLIETWGIPREAIIPEQRYSNLWPKKGRTSEWHRFREHLGIKVSARPWTFIPPGNTTIADTVLESVARSAKQLLLPGENWTYAQIREVIRSGVTYTVSIKEFSDDDRFAKDLGIS